MVLRFVIVLLLSMHSYASSQIDSSREHSYNVSILAGYNQTIKLNQYMKLETLELLFGFLGRKFGDIAKPVDLAKRSAVNRTMIRAMQISRDVRNRRELLKPMVKLVANIHGNDAVGYALLTFLTQYLVYNDGKDTRVSRLLNTTDIWIIPTMNPDGFSRAIKGCDHPDVSEGETNGRGVDLDENFPAVVYKGSMQPETQNMLELILQKSFVLSGNLQGGAIVASYPYDHTFYSANGATTDDKVFKKLAKDYADRNHMMSPGTACNRTFPGGITNGGTWNVKTASMQDANYHLSNCFEITLHLSCCKYPPASDLPMYWDANLDAMLSFIESARQGIYGQVMDKFRNPIENAVIDVVGNDKEIKATDRGEYWRLLAPGNYIVSARAPAAHYVVHKVNITENNTYVHLDFILTRQGVYGQVKDPKGEPLETAIINVEKINKKEDSGRSEGSVRSSEDSVRSSEGSVRSSGSFKPTYSIKSEGSDGSDSIRSQGSFRREGSIKSEGIKIKLNQYGEYWQFLPLGEYNLTATVGRAKETRIVNLTVS